MTATPETEIQRADPSRSPKPQAGISEPRTGTFILLPVVVVGLWFGFWKLTISTLQDWQTRGLFGDMFGAINALFSGLAFAILIYTMWLQKAELALQRLELQQTRDELRRSADAQEASRKALDAQIKLSAFSAEMSAWVQATAIWTAPEFLAGRSTVLARFHHGMDVWSVGQREEAKEVCRRMDEFAYLVRFLDLQKVLEAWDDPLAKCWLALDPIVKDERAQTNWPTKWHKFEELGSAAHAKLVKEGRDPRPPRA